MATHLPARRRSKTAAVATPARRPRAAPVLATVPPAPPADEEVDAHGFPIDRLVHAWQAQFTGGLSPAALQQAFSDWGIHLANAPGKQAELLRKAMRKWLRYLDYINRARVDSAAAPAIEPLPGDRRFLGADWQRQPFPLIWQGFLFTQQWWHNATTDIRGVDPRHAEVVHFAMRQILDALSPANFLPTNPEVLRVTAEQAGQNLWRGCQNWIEDAERVLLGRPPVGADAFQVGRDVAITPGKVVYRNRLIELIQYSPMTTTARPEPVLIVPAWIMKYYILDLSPANSLVRYLVDRGHTVFMVSWKNPTATDRDLSMDDYLEFGPLKALEAVRAIVPGAPKVHAAGYCLGGTLLAIAAAKLARAGDDVLKSVTLFAAQTDFTEAGELMLFINQSQVAWLEDMMWDQGFLDTHQMSGAFQLLRSQDLIWSSMVREYLLGERTPMTDLMAWNADATRMPYHMHAEYLQKLFLENDLAEGRFQARGELVSLADIKVPIFAVSTTRDHIAPWRSVYKINWLTQSDVTFVLASGGHNAGIVSEPQANGAGPQRQYRIGTIAHGDYHVDPDTWFNHAKQHDGSWWPAWGAWLEAWSGDPGPLPAMGAAEAGFPPLADAPGSYVLAR
ncbi:MAG: polyhydroxyalkanoic acid synthase [Alphaproteobacteria bacterium]|nr:polyhydroxyalkanoic acid synthase [Alphaproteobacteria bacterium]